MTTMIMMMTMMVMVMMMMMMPRFVGFLPMKSKNLVGSEEIVQ